MDVQRRKVWSKKHGHDTYDSDLDEDELKTKGQKKHITGGMCKCGFTTHQRTNHSDCPLNEKIKKSGVPVDDRASENSDVIFYSEDSPSGAHSQAHKKECSLNSQNRYVGCTLFLRHLLLTLSSLTVV